MTNQNSVGVTQPTRPWLAAQVAIITSFWSRKRNEPYHIGKNGVMGEMEGGLKILLRWRCSLWKLVWKELTVYLLCYVAISLVYRYAMDSYHQTKFEESVLWLKSANKDFVKPLTFLLGFYVSLVVKRWWEQYIKLPWPDEVATLLKAAVSKEKETKGAVEEAELEAWRTEGLRIRRTVVRYMVLSYVLCVRRISTRVRRAYPSMQSLEGLISPQEVKQIGLEQQQAIGAHGGSNWWLPIKWSVGIVRDAFLAGRVVPPVYTVLVKSIADYRKSLTQVITYGHVPVPLVYTQVVHLAVHFYFFASLLGRQWIHLEEGRACKEHENPLDVPIGLWLGQAFTFWIFLAFEFLFYFGWLNVASTLYNPFGDDDDDFELMGLMNRHIKVCMKIVDEDRDEIPDLEENDIWETPVGAGQNWHPTLPKPAGRHKEKKTSTNTAEEGRSPRASHLSLLSSQECQLSEVKSQESQRDGDPETGSLAQQRDPSEN